MPPPPRILLISSEAPHTDAAGAIVFHRLFHDYPADRLLVITNNLPPAGAGRLDCRYVPVRLLVDRLMRTRFWPWRNAARVLGGSRLIRLGRLDRALGNFQPDMVATLMQDSWYYELAARYARQRGLPLWLFIHDLPAGFEPVAAFLRPAQHARDLAVFRQASVRLCISPGMADHFESVCGRRGDVLLPPRSDRTPTQDPAACRNLKSPGHLTLGYAGGLHYGYGEQLLRILPLLRATGTRLELCGPRPTGVVTALAGATDVITFHGHAARPEEAWQTLLNRCDAILQPYLNPPGRHELQYRTHFPSKLGDCLSLGMPLLITGPSEASGVAWCRQHPGTSLIVSDPDPAALTAALTRLRDDGALRTALAGAARAAATAFDAPGLRARFHDRLLGFPPRTLPVPTNVLVECRVPTYRRPKLLQRALRSLLAQTEPRWRAVVLDDSPDQEGRAVVDSLADPRIEYRPNPRNLGAAGNLDQAFAPLALVGGSHAFVLEDDNAIQPRFIERGLALLASGRHAILTFNQRIIDFRENPDGTYCGDVRPQAADTSWTPDQMMLLAFLGKSLPNGAYFWRLGQPGLNLVVGASLRDAQMQEYVRQLRIKEPILVSHEALSDWSHLPADDLRRTVLNHRTFAANLNQLCRVLIGEYGLARLHHLMRTTEVPAEHRRHFETILADLSLLSPPCLRWFPRAPGPAIRAVARLFLYGGHSRESLRLLLTR